MDKVKQNRWEIGCKRQQMKLFLVVLLQQCNVSHAIMTIPRGHSSQSGEVEMHGDNCHLDEQSRLYMTSHEMDEVEMPPHISQTAHREQFNFEHLKTATLNK